MTITVRKAGEAASKALGKTVLRPPRAVSAAEAPSIEPARESTHQTMMPWKGWFQRWVKETFGEKRYQQMRNTFLFMPDDIYDLQQSPMPTKKIQISKTDPNVTAMYRYPSPGSQGPVAVPQLEEGEDPYDSGYFKRDTRRRYLSSELGDKELEMRKLEFMDPNDPKVQEEKERIATGPESSKGNKLIFATGPTDFDKTGLRATQSVTWSALEASLDQHMPDHLPTPTWAGKEQEIVQWYKDRDLPAPVGGYYEPLKVPRERRVASW